MSKEKLQLFFVFSAILLLMVGLSRNLSGYEIASVALFFFILLKFIFDLGNHIAIKNIIVLLMVMQWLLGAVLGYIYDSDIATTYQMKVDQSVYFAYVLPATLAYITGIYIRIRKQPYKPNFHTTVDHYQKGTNLILLGFLFELIPLGFLGYLLAGLKYVGAFYMVLTPNKKRYYWIALVFGYLFLIRSLGSGLFHELLLWTCFLLILVFYFNRKPFLFRFAIIFSGFFFVFILQLVKPDYRAQMGTNTGDSKYVLFFNLVSSKLTGDQPLFSEDLVANNVVRLNQGWIISNVMDYIPDHRPYAQGQTVEDAIIASIFPRFMFPSKAKAGGQSNMENYAGIHLREGTSMDISQVGEAYANFGVAGGILMMFILGLFSNVVITFVEKKCLKHPELILWLPLLYLQVVKAETSLVTVLNHLVKAGLVTWFFFTPYGVQLLNYRFSRIKFGRRPHTLATITIGTPGVRKRKGIRRTKRYTVFEDRFRKRRREEEE